MYRYIYKRNKYIYIYTHMYMFYISVYISWIVSILLYMLSVFFTSLRHVSSMFFILPYLGGLLGIS